MKFMQKTWVAWLLTAVMIAAALCIGQTKNYERVPAAPAPSPSAGLDSTLSTSGYNKWIWDDANILSQRGKSTSTTPTGITATTAWWLL